jgi:hypothetical protein
MMTPRGPRLQLVKQLPGVLVFKGILICVDNAYLGILIH